MYKMCCYLKIKDGSIKVTIKIAEPSQFYGDEIGTESKLDHDILTDVPIGTE